ncbi:hypothetical protein [Sulfuracidifex metallicus]|uniref:hypothetical protein n=1 Tax=Sulfuracidifex metallicus TaxID=47303 RepID=UPI000A506D40|nr:hypothetical protein [Sulfuracidifex metallicus]
METQVKEGVIFSLSFQEALDRATSLISGYKAKPLLIGSFSHPLTTFLLQGYFGI